MTKPADEVIVVDEHDRAIGRCEKLEAHRGPGVLHRAFSVVLLDDSDHVLLQRRAADKHHFRLLWSNSCCSHPRPDESIDEAVDRRLVDELGLSARTTSIGRIRYRAADDESGLVEDEIDHVVLGRVRGHRCVPSPAPAEIDDWCWLSADAVEAWHDRHPAQFTPWFPLVLAVLHDVMRGRR